MNQLDPFFNPNNFITLFNQLTKKKQKQYGQGIIQKLVEMLPFEMHIPGYNYCGPGTKLDKRLKRGDKGINRVDEVCKKHDIAYRDAQNMEDIKIADNNMLQALDEIKDPTMGERIGKVIAKTGIKAKKLLGSGAQIYCVKCKKITATNNISEKTTKNKRRMLTGVCDICGSKKSKFISSK